MPLPLKVDREAVRTLVVAVGVREAARQMNLPQATVQAWSARGKWTAKVKAAQQIRDERLQPHVQPALQSPPNALQPVENAPKSLQPSATTPADALAKTLSDASRETRLNLVKATGKAAKALSGMPGDVVARRSQDLRHVTAAASSLHGWEEKKDSGVVLNLALVVSNMT